MTVLSMKIPLSRVSYQQEDAGHPAIRRAAPRSFQPSGPLVSWGLGAEGSVFTGKPRMWHQKLCADWLLPDPSLSLRGQLLCLAFRRNYVLYIHYLIKGL